MVNAEKGGRRAGRGRPGCLFLSGGVSRAPACPPEGSDTEIEENHHDHRRRHRGAMIGAREEAESRPPESRSEDHDGKKEKDAGDFEPQNTAHATERAEQPSHTANQISRRGRDRPRAGNARGLRKSLGTCSRRSHLRRSAHALAGYATRYP